MKAELINVQTGERLVLSKLPALVGRDRRVDVVIHDSEVSRYHCMIDENPGGGLVVWDLGTGACVAVNRRPAMKAYLRSGDELTLGKTRLRVEYGPTAPRFGEVLGTASCAS